MANQAPTTKRNANQAMVDLIAVGYRVVPYPDQNAPTALIIKQGQRTVTTLPVSDGGVCEESVAYLISEAKYEQDPVRRG